MMAAESDSRDEPDHVPVYSDEIDEALWVKLGKVHDGAHVIAITR